MKLLYTVKEVFSDDGYLQIDQMKGYKIPLYQRSYKWTAREVQKLLTDINTFDPADEKFYCLQNITIVPDNDLKVFNVVDGQQRLTTLTLLLSYLEEKKLVQHKVTFPKNSIRTETNKFINLEIIQNDFDLTLDWDIFIKQNTNYNHQDIYHLFHAYKAINDWFSSQDILKDNFRKKLLGNVKLIINRIESKNDEEEIFSNLNSKKIPLDGADLFRAILITRAAAEETKKDASIKDIIQLNEKRAKIGWEFDTINNWWSKKDVKSYYKPFSGKTDIVSVDQKLFDHDKHPINLLLSLFSESEGKSSLTLEFLESYNNSALVLYKKLQKLHHTLQDWYKDREIYHFLGFLFVNSSIMFKTIWDKWLASETRDEFKEGLKEIIRKEIFNTEIDFEDPSINWYHDEKKLLIKVLILLDVIYSLDKSQPFMNPVYFTKNSNDIEHIFPQNPEKPRDKKEFLEFLNTNILEEKFDLKDFDKKCLSDQYLQEVENFILKQTNDIKTNSIGNLVLLFSSLNKSIGRKPYSLKRLKVINYHNEGSYIQPHTFRVFVRYFNNHNTEVKELQHWTNHDIEANAAAINKKIRRFFNIN